MGYRAGFFAVVLVLAACAASVFWLYGPGVADSAYNQAVQRAGILALSPSQPASFSPSPCTSPPMEGEGGNGYVQLPRPNATVMPPEYYRDADTLIYSYDRHVKSIDDFEPWKDLILSVRMPGLNLGAVEPGAYWGSAVAPGHAFNGAEPGAGGGITTTTLIASGDRDGYTMEKYAIPSCGAGDGLFYKLVPDVPSDRAILLLSGMGDSGFNDVAGEPSKWGDLYYQDEIGKKLTLAGYTVYAPEWYGAGERGVAFRYCADASSTCNGSVFIALLDRYGISVMDLMAYDMAAITSVIDSEFDRVGIAGLSLGGHMSIHTAVYHPDTYDAVASASGHFSVHEQFATHGWYADNLQYYDYRDILASFAPKPLYTSAGVLETHVVDFEAVTNHSSDYVRGAYALHGAEDRYVNVLHPGSHGYDAESLIGFFDRFL